MNEVVESGFVRSVYSNEWRLDYHLALKMVLSYRVCVVNICGRNFGEYRMALSATHWATINIEKGVYE